MATIVTRSGKGSPLTHAEVDVNFENLNSDKAEVSSLGTAAAADTTDFVSQTSATGAAVIPTGTEAQRPTPATGQLRFNTDAATFEGYNGTEWGAIAGSGGETSFLQYKYTATAAQTTFSGADDNSATLSYTVNNLIVTLNGVVLDNGGDYTATNGTSVVLTSGAAAGDLLQVIAFKSFTVADMVPASTGGTFAGNVATTGSLTAASASITGNLTVDTNTLFVDAANNLVGVGTSSPQGVFAISGGSSPQVILSNTDGTSNDSHNFRIGTFAGTTPFWSSLTLDASSLRFQTFGAERARIDASGNLLVGKTASSVTTPGSETTSLGFRAIANTSNSGYFYNQTVGTTGVVGLWRVSNVDVGSISVTASTTAYNTSSDYRLKENVVPLAGAADRLAQIPVHRFNFIVDPDTTVDGFLAHEVQAFVPECVTGLKNQVETVDVKDEDGNVIGTEERPVYQGIDQSKLVPLLTAALQEALARIETLEADVAALKGDPA